MKRKIGEVIIKTKYSICIECPPKSKDRSLLYMCLQNHLTSCFFFYRVCYFGCFTFCVYAVFASVRSWVRSIVGLNQELQNLYLLIYIWIMCLSEDTCLFDIESGQCVWMKRHVLLTCSLNNVSDNLFLLVKWKSSLRQFYACHHALANRYGISVSQMTPDVFQFLSTSRSFHH